MICWVTRPEGVAIEFCSGAREQALGEVTRRGQEEVTRRGRGSRGLPRPLLPHLSIKEKALGSRGLPRPAALREVTRRGETRDERGIEALRARAAPPQKCLARARGQAKRSLSIRRRHHQRASLASPESLEHTEPQIPLYPKYPRASGAQKRLTRPRRLDRLMVRQTRLEHSSDAWEE